MSASIKVFDKLSDNVVSFDNKEDFMKYYGIHKEEIDLQPTRGLNLKYQIKGYKIGRKAGNVVLYPVRGQTVSQPPVSKEDVPEESPKAVTSAPPPQTHVQQPAPAPSANTMSIEDKLNNLNKRLKQVEQAINEIYDELDSQK